MENEEFHFLIDITTPVKLEVISLIDSGYLSKNKIRNLYIK